MSETDSDAGGGSSDSNEGGGAESSRSIRDRLRLSRVVPAFIRRRYAAKFVVSILFVVIVIASIGAVGYLQTSEIVEQDTRDSLNSTATLQADSLSQWVETKETQTVAVASADEMQGDEDQMQSHLFGWAGQTGTEVVSIHFVDTSTNTITATTDTGIRGETLSDVDEPWADPAVEDEVIYTRDVWYPDSAYVSGMLDMQVISFVADVPGRNGYVVLIASIENRVQGLHQGDANQTTTILNSNGNPVLLEDQREDTRVMGDDREHDQVTKTLDSGEVQFDQRDGLVFAYAPVPDTGWVAVTSSPTEAAFAVRNEVGQSVLSIVVVSLLALGAVAVVLGRQTLPPLIRLRQRATEMEAGKLDVDLETRREDEIGQLYRAFDNMRDSLRNRIREAQTAREEAEQARVETERMNQHLEEKAEEYGAVMETAASGDLTERMEPDGENEAMAQIARTFNEMLAELEATLEEVKNFATEVATASEEVTGSSEEVRSASEQVTESVQQISDGAERQNESLQSVSQEMEELSTTTEEIAASSNEVADIAEQTAHTGREGRDAAQAAIDGMNSIEAESEEAVSEIEHLQAEVAQIDELLEFITDVAQQTNILALNANIEAAHADEGSEGFAVIANQVKELASDTQNAAEDIEDRLEQIKEQTDSTASEVRRTADEIADQTDSVRAAAGALEEIAGYAQETNTGIQQISAATQQQAATAQEVVQMADDASTISEETTAEAETVAAAAEQQTAALTEVSRSASDLALQASQLSEALDHFATDTDADGPDTEAQKTSEEAVDIDGEALSDVASGDTFSFVDLDSDETTRIDVEAEETSQDVGDETDAEDDRDETAEDDGSAISGGPDAADGDAE